MHLLKSSSRQLSTSWCSGVDENETNGPGSNLRLTNFVQIYLYFLKVENYQVIACYYDSRPNMVLYSSVPRWVALGYEK